ncbi:MAG: hypothetical protein SAJ12_04190 [Jaaginema sp. PMC 1079.18]|nr:hypothetical protein [Jaaginema sp. PMC 1080.18]MEC4850189.1 hypothetical protein [Jaaginema sp. PMC 1079.18]MEC4865298.1 hypothetical protein [Jaaginema sp. PMC 1078.18]
MKHYLRRKGRAGYIYNTGDRAKPTQAAQKIRQFLQCDREVISCQPPDSQIT